MEAMNLGRIGHYHVPKDDTSGSCQTAIVTAVDRSAGGDTVNLGVWQRDGDAFARQDVPAVVPPPAEHASFHLNRDCPYSR